MKYSSPANYARNAMPGSGAMQTGEIALLDEAQCRELEAFLVAGDWSASRKRWIRAGRGESVYLLP